MARRRRTVGAASAAVTVTAPSVLDGVADSTTSLDALDALMDGDAIASTNEAADADPEALDEAGAELEADEVANAEAESDAEAEARPEDEADAEAKLDEVTALEVVSVEDAVTLAVTEAVSLLLVRHGRTATPHKTHVKAAVDVTLAVAEGLTGLEALGVAEVDSLASAISYTWHVLFVIFLVAILLLPVFGRSRLTVVLVFQFIAVGLRSKLTSH